MNSVVTDCVSHPNGVSALVLTKSGMQTIRGKLFICADGIHSKIRTQIFDAPPSKHTGFEAWRTMIPAEKVPARFALDFTHLIWGRGKHAVLYPVRGGRHMNLVVITKSREKTDLVRKKQDPKFLRFKTFFWNTKFKALINAATDWSVWPILECPQTKSWYNGPMVMIGDAAHGMEPYAAQGAAMAIEDAKVLADELGEEQDLSSALANFQKARKSRVAKVAKLARANRNLYHMGFPFSTVRNIGMAFLSGKSLLERQAWIYEWRSKI
jgi:salicylate hydroxylase